MPLLLQWFRILGRTFSTLFMPGKPQENMPGTAMIKMFSNKCKCHAEKYAIVNNKFLVNN